MSGRRTRERLKLYPPDWKEVVARVRARSGDRCECTGQCGLHSGDLSDDCAEGSHVPCPYPISCICTCHDKPGAERSHRCTERNGEPAKWARGEVVLTTAHLCHDPSCREMEHLRHMCQRCHLRYDGPLHVQHSAETRQQKRADALTQSGQRELFTEESCPAASKT